MTPDKVVTYIDKVVVEQIQLGFGWNDICQTLKEKIINYKNRNSYIQVTENYLINNWDRIEWSKRMTTMIVIQSQRRLFDIEWIENNQYKFPDLDSIGIYKLMNLKDKLRETQLSNS
jgi:hypothetical protein